MKFAVILLATIFAYSHGLDIKTLSYENFCSDGKVYLSYPIEGAAFEQVRDMLTLVNKIKKENKMDKFSAFAIPFNLVKREDINKESVEPTPIQFPFRSFVSLTEFKQYYLQSNMKQLDTSKVSLDDDEKPLKDITFEDIYYKTMPDTIQFKYFNVLACIDETDKKEDVQYYKLRYIQIRDWADTDAQWKTFAETNLKLDGKTVHVVSFDEDTNKFYPVDYFDPKNDHKFTQPDAGVTRNIDYIGDVNIYADEKNPKKLKAELTVATQLIKEDILKKGFYRVGGTPVTKENEQFRYVNCMKTAVYLYGSDYDNRVFSVEGNFMWGQDLIAFAKQAEKKELHIPLRAGQNDEWRAVNLEVLQNIELVENGSGDTATYSVKSKLFDIGTGRETESMTIINEIKKDRYYQFNGCLHVQKELKNLHDNTPSAVGEKKIVSLQAGYLAEYIKKGETPINCDCKECCRPGPYYSVVSAIPGCIKKDRNMLQYWAYQYDLSIGKLNSFIQFLKFFNKLKEDKLNTILVIGQPETLSNADKKIKISDILMKLVLDEAKDLLKAKKGYTTVSECTFCSALSKQFFNLWNHDKWLRQIVRTADQKYVGPDAALMRFDLGNFEGWDRNDPNMFAVCDVCVINKDEASKMMYECTNPIEKPDITHKTIRDLTDKELAPQYHPYSNMAKILHPSGYIENDKARKYRLVKSNERNMFKTQAAKTVAHSTYKSGRSKDLSIATGKKSAYLKR